ncbi:hypothetical protein E0H75_04810 [Kribbella capetownensis]|uniref:Uncharacterized protein n=1 Tax=Kribbella capetownensis TaxID=1572659 RepID=A0A4R0K1Y8_9ACTN|nr:hypothetical protein [Kribbella capetownensis]TCC53057.1 hypothetical protein E0H75_04810 [Kribbella capetownensis]
MPPPEPDPVQARRTTTRLLWACAALTVLVGVFQLAGILNGDGEYDALAWIGVAIAAVSLLALIGIYCACALERLSLRTRVFRLDLFQVTTVLLLVAIVAGVLVPSSNTTALALLLPWGLTYWLHNLNQPAE